MNENTDLIVKAIGQAHRNALEGDKAIIEVLMKLVDTVVRLQNDATILSRRISQLEDLHRLEEHHDDLHGV